MSAIDEARKQMKKMLRHQPNTPPQQFTEDREILRQIQENQNGQSAEPGFWQTEDPGSYATSEFDSRFNPDGSLKQPDEPPQWGRNIGKDMLRILSGRRRKNG